MSLSIASHLYFKSLASKIVFPIGLAIDTTYKCNLKCKHCYFQKQNYKSELSTEAWIKKIEKIKKSIPGIISAEWVGGEPLLRPNLIAQGMKFFSSNVIITNGTIKLPDWKKCVFLVSIDGTKKYYEKTRGKNIYDKIKNNINRDDVNVSLVFTINKKNAICIEAFLEEWSATKIQDVLFIFYTPIKGIKEDLWLNWEERDKVIEKLIILKNKYKNFIENDFFDLEAMKSKNAKKILKECLFKKKMTIALDPNGKVKEHCNMGKKADCSRCGSITPYYLPYLKKSKIELSAKYKKIFF